MYAALVDVGQTLVAGLVDRAGANESGLLASGQAAEQEQGHGVAHNASADDGMVPYVPVLDRPETYIVTVLYTLIFIVGVLGNGTLVIIFFRHRSMRNIPNTYILSLALADLLVILVCVPVATIVYTQESWPFDRNMCRISEFFKDISIGVSVFTLTALSGERYCAIVNPLRKLQTKPLTVFTAVIIWILAILLGMPSVLFSDIKSYPVFTAMGNITIEVCSPFRDPEYAKFMVAAKALIYYLLPLSIIGALYIMMANRLHMSARNMPGEQQSMQSRTQARARRHVARMVVAFVCSSYASSRTTCSSCGTTSIPRRRRTSMTFGTCSASWDSAQASSTRASTPWPSTVCQGCSDCTSTAICAASASSGIPTCDSTPRGWTTPP
nr:neuropeptide CCHamide-2 receptor isoform X2 [Drosophila suzukii]